MAWRICTNINVCYTYVLLRAYLCNVLLESLWKGCQYYSSATRHDAHAAFMLRLLTYRCLIAKCSKQSIHPPQLRSALHHDSSYTAPNIIANAPVQLRPYQESCLHACLEALKEPNTSRIGISLPTGSGKTTVFVTLISMLNAPSTSQEATRALIIVNNIELARQSAEQVKRMFPDLSVEIDQGSKNNASGVADV